MYLAKLANFSALGNEEVGYGEPSPEEVYRAAYNCPMIDSDRRAVAMTIEELSEESWDLLSLEHGVQRQPVRVWLSSEISTWTSEQLRDGYRNALEEFRKSYSSRIFG